MGEGPPSATVPAFRTDGGTSGDLTLDFITSTSSPKWIRWQSMKSRALRLAFCLEMRRNGLIQHLTLALGTTWSVRSQSWPWLANLPSFSCIHPPTQPSNMHSVLTSATAANLLFCCSEQETDMVFFSPISYLKHTDDQKTLNHLTQMPHRGTTRFRMNLALSKPQLLRGACERDSQA